MLTATAHNAPREAMMTRTARITTACLAALLLASGCARPADDGAAQEPQAGDEAGQPGTSRATTPPPPTVVYGNGGLMPSLEAAGLVGGTAAPHEPPPSVPEPEARQVLDRLWIDVDVPALLETPVWSLLKGTVLEEAEPEQRCLIDLLPKVQSVFVTMRLGDGDPQEMVVSAQTTADSATVETCLLAAAREELQPVAGDVAGRPGHLGTLDGEEKAAALVEAAPGWWLFGHRAAVEAAATAGTPPGDAPEYTELAGPLGPSVVRIVALPGPDFLRAGPEAGDTPPALVCFVDAWPRFTGFGLGAAWNQGLDLSLSVGHRDAAAASESRACFESAWTVAADAIRRGLATATDPREQALAGRPMEEMLDSIRIEAPGALVVARGSVPAQIIFAMLARVMD
jgi:hypothetical protein